MNQYRLKSFHGSVFVFFVFTASLGAQDWASHHAMSSSDFQAKFDSYSKKGYRPVQIDGYAVSNKPHYAAIWIKKSGPAMAVHHGMSSSDYQARFDSYSKKGYRPLQVDGFGIGNKSYYTAIWEKKSGPALQVHHGLSGGDYQKKVDDYIKSGYRLTSVSGYSVGGKARYAAIWEKSSGPAYFAHHGMTPADYQKKFTDYAKQGYRLKMVSGYGVGNQDYYAAIWEKKSGPSWSARHRMSTLGYQNQFDNHAYKGFKLTHLSGYTRGGKAQFAGIWESTSLWSSADLGHIDSTIGAFMKKHNVPGTAVAIVKDGRLVFAQGYGALDPADGEAPGPNSMFRVASVSKPITGATVMKMVQDGKLKLDDKVFGSGAVLGTTYGSNPYGAKEKAIEVQHLLSHTAAGKTWNNRGDDGSGAPMFQQTSYNHKQLIGWVLDNREPEMQPGNKYDYSNFGFCVLGRVIEKKTGQPYEQYVKNSILDPWGIRNMHIANDKKTGRRYNEAVYKGGGAYGMPVKRMDAHGGWIASPVDLMRFVVRFDGFATKPDVLNATHFSTMTSGSSANNNYGKGWVITGSNYWHNGSFSGSGAILVRAGNGLSWAFLMTDTWKSDADGMMWDVVNGIKTWPKTDLFTTIQQ